MLIYALEETVLCRVWWKVLWTPQYGYIFLYARPILASQITDS